MHTYIYIYMYNIYIILINVKWVFWVLVTGFLTKKLFPGYPKR